VFILPHANRFLILATVVVFRHYDITKKTGDSMSLIRPAIIR